MGIVGVAQTETARYVNGSFTAAVERPSGLPSAKEVVSDF
jgi:hypothetical protein